MKNISRTVIVALTTTVLLQVGGIAAAYPANSVELEGHGWGHGRGMGQYGALGYAVSHGWNHTQILNHFYGGTSADNYPDSNTMSVRLMKFSGLDTIVVQEQGKLGTSAATGEFQSIKISLISTNLFRVFSRPSIFCGSADEWMLLGEFAGPITLWSNIYNDSADDHTTMLQVCEPDGTTRWLRGALQVVDVACPPSGEICEGSSFQETTNHLTVRSYLRGVVPRESPSSWGDQGGGAGMNALRAQAVGARSYALSEGRQWYAKTCDTTACQVYAGYSDSVGGFRLMEATNTNNAIDQTSGEVRRRGGCTGDIAGCFARTEFSSSTGGWTAGGAFSAVRDDGDNISSNPNHYWKVSVPVSAVESAYPEIGSLSSISITERNGLGDWGGRVKALRLSGSKGSKITTGNDFRSKLGLKSDWFNVIFPGGYWVVGSDGGVFSFGNAQFYGSTGGIRLRQPIVGMGTTANKQGYWLVASDGGVFSFGNAAFHGSTGGSALNRPIVGMAPTPGGGGYWLVASDGGIFAFGDAGFFGSTGAMTLRQPIVGMAPTPTGNGYWLVASDGGIFAFGDAGFFGSTGAMTLRQPIVGMAAMPSGNGYWLVASDGGIFSFGDSRFHGSTGGMRLAAPITAMAATPSGGGYYLVGRDGGIFTFGDAGFFGSVPGAAPSSTTAKVDVELSYLQ